MSNSPRDRAAIAATRGRPQQHPPQHYRITIEQDTLALRCQRCGRMRHLETRYRTTFASYLQQFLDDHDGCPLAPPVPVAPVQAQAQAQVEA